MRSVIYWFSGTGNSLYAAKRLSAELGDTALYPMAPGARSDAQLKAGDRVGLVFPSYYGNLPRTVRSFVEKLDIPKGVYIFGVVTMAGPGQGSPGALADALGKKGLELAFGRGVIMPRNYVCIYNPAKSGGSMKRVDRRLRSYACDIQAGVRRISRLPMTSDKLYNNIEQLDALFSADNSCTSCGLCERVCPSRNITLENGKPKWLHHCEHCVACIQWCPAQAIQYGDRTKARRRYHHASISASEIAAQKG